jgi:hypothetical protein
MVRCDHAGNSVRCEACIHAGGHDPVRLAWTSPNCDETVHRCSLAPGHDADVRCVPDAGRIAPPGE